jgi:hypothetical protein
MYKKSLFLLIFINEKKKFPKKNLNKYLVYVYIELYREINISFEIIIKIYISKII